MISNIKAKFVAAILVSMALASVLMGFALNRAYQGNRRAVLRDAVVEGGRDFESALALELGALASQARLASSSATLATALQPGGPEGWRAFGPDGQPVAMDGAAPLADPARAAASAGGYAAIETEAGAVTLRAVSAVRDPGGAVVGFLSVERGLAAVVRDFTSRGRTRIAVAVASGGPGDAPIVVPEEAAQDAALGRVRDHAAKDVGDGLVVDAVEEGDELLAHGVVPVRRADGALLGNAYVVNPVGSIHRVMRGAPGRVMVAFLVLAVVLSLIIVTLLGRLIFRRLDAVVEAATRVAGGEFDRQIPVTRNDEVGKLENLVEQMRSIISTLVSDSRSGSGPDAER